METLESLQRRITSANDLFGIIRTMKVLAAASIRQFEQAVEAVGIYSNTIETGFRFALWEQPLRSETPLQKSGGTLAVIFGTDQGMCGQFNENILSFALNDLENLQNRKIIVGQRAASKLEETGVPFESLFHLPSSVEAINPAVQSLLLRINTLRESDGLEKVVLYYNRPVSLSAYQPVRVQLLPIDLNPFRTPVKTKDASRSLPMYSMDRERLLSRLISQYLFVQVYRAYAESLASENTSRLVTMQVAEKNIQERLYELNTQYHNLRQDSITSEMLDIVSGVEALGEQNLFFSEEEKSIWNVR